MGSPVYSQYSVEMARVRITVEENPTPKETILSTLELHFMVAPAETTDAQSLKSWTVVGGGLPFFGVEKLLMPFVRCHNLCFHSEVGNDQVFVCLMVVAFSEDSVGLLFVL